ncbi:MAG: cell wall hydrolase [Caldicoprobacterales bacterium]|nr:cell wall hydrolase [Clostridiales bacterium]
MKTFLAVCIALLIFIPAVPAQSAYDSSEEIAIRQLINNLTLNSLWTEEDIHLMARTVHGEARGENHLGKVAVASVILNRVNSPQFPNTIKEVVYQPRAFTCVDYGQINLKPNLAAYLAVSDAILGNDPTNGCLFYMNPEIATSRWMHQRASAKPVTVIGNHVFMH